MSAKLYRNGENWVIQALGRHVFFSARDARAWARENRLKLVREKFRDQ